MSPKVHLCLLFADDSVSFDINGVTLILQTGSITDQNVDGIVHGTNAQFTSNGK